MKAVLITGAAAGIGLVTARRFARDGWFVGLYDVNGSAVEALLRTPEFTRACGGVCDVRKREDIARMLTDFCEHTQGQLHALVNNAGVLSAGPFAEMDPVAHERMIDINVRGLTQVAELAFAPLQKTPGSVLVNLCSLSSVHGVPLLAVYSATKFYVDGLTEALALEWRAYDIHVTSVKPPFVKTAMLEGMPPQLTRTLGVDMAPETVAEAIWQAVIRRRAAQVLGLKSKLFAGISRCLPGRLRHWLMAQLSGY